MSYQGESSELELRARRAPFEVDAATRLGLLLVNFGRLDLAVQLYLAGVAPHAPGAAAPDLEDRLATLLAHADGLADRAVRAEFVRWIVQARHLAPLGRALREGRWLPDPRRNVVLLLAAPGRPLRDVPGSSTLEELDGALRAVRELMVTLHRLCAAERGLSPADVASFLTTQPIAVAEEA